MKRPLLRRLVLLSALGGVAVLLCVRSPHQPGSYPPCPFYALTGLYCPGCGTLRSLHALLQGDVLQALAYNSLAIVLLPFVIGSLVWGIVVELRRPREAVRPWPAWPLRVLLGLILVYWILRNVPLAPFDVLAPHPLAVTRD